MVSWSSTRCIASIYIPRHHDDLSQGEFAAHATYVPQLPRVIGNRSVGIRRRHEVDFILWVHDRAAFTQGSGTVHREGPLRVLREHVVLSESMSMLIIGTQRSLCMYRHRIH